MLFDRWLFLLHSICPGFPGEERLYDDLNKEHSLQSVISSTVWNTYFYLIAWGTVLALTQTHYATESQTHSPLILVFICVFGFPLEFADSTCRFFCSIYFAEQFSLLRKRIFADGEEKYELHFVIDYMNRSYWTRKLLYSLIPWTPIPRPGGGGGVYAGRFLLGVWYAVTQFESVYSSAPVRVLFRQVSSNAARYFSLSSLQNLISIRTVRNNNSPIYKREGDGNLNVSRNGFWNRDLIDQSGQ